MERYLLAFFILLLGLVFNTHFSNWFYDFVAVFVSWIVFGMWFDSVFVTRKYAMEVFKQALDYASKGNTNDNKDSSNTDT
jgi:hypothetical protein